MPEDVSYHRANGDQLSAADFEATVTEPASTLVRITEPVYEWFSFPRESGFRGRRLKFQVGDVVDLAEVAGLFADATVELIEPAVGPVAGGTEVTITGTNLRGVTSVTFGGTEVDDLDVVDDETVSVISPAGAAAGPVDVAVTDDSGTVTVTDGFTYE